MQRFIGKEKIGSHIILSEEETKHIKASRLKVKDSLEVWLNDRLYLCSLEQLEHRQALCRILKEDTKPFPKPKVMLCQCVPIDLKSMDYIVEKVSEAGAYRLFPIVSSRSFRNVEVVERRLERWERLSLASFKQCGRPIPMLVERPIKLEDIEAKEDLNLLLDNFSEGKSMKEIDLKGVESVSLVVGPEGGFAEKESKALVEKGFISIRLHPFVLRSETASVVAVGLLMNLYGI
ncbi:MAG: RsmE family RNA methyltransferase [Aquificaceae bacterium]